MHYPPCTLLEKCLNETLAYHFILLTIFMYIHVLQYLLYLTVPVSDTLDFPILTATYLTLYGLLLSMRDGKPSL